MHATAPNLEITPPRSGREFLGPYAWLARLIDKVRAERAGTNGDYIAYCELSMGYLARSGISKDAFDARIAEGANDAAIQRYFDERVDLTHRDAANDYILNEMKSHLDQQDAEEGRTPGHP
jgi:hypothetical protein